MNKITRKSFLKVLAATMVGGAAASALTGAAAPVSIDETNGKVSRWVKNNLNPDGPLTIAKQGMFSSGGTVTAPVAGTYDATTNWLDTTRAGNTAHVDHANVLYQIPADSNGWPMVYLHGYGGDCTVVDLPKIGITGNSHFMFQELNNKEIADHIYQWLESRALA